MTAMECVNCGLAACDLPDGVDPEVVFETEGDVTMCQGCAAYGTYVALDCGCGAQISGNPLCICRDPDDDPPVHDNEYVKDAHGYLRTVHDVGAGGLL